MTIDHRAIAALALLLVACAPGTDLRGTSNSGRHILVLPPAGGELDDPTMDIDAEYAISTTTIQGAIDAAVAGDTVDVPSGVYLEDVTMKAGVNVDGAGIAESYIVGTVTFDSSSTAATTLQDVTVYSSSLYDSGTYYVGDGVTFTGAGAATAIQVIGFQAGVSVAAADSVSINSSTLAYNWYGLSAEGSTNLTLGNSHVTSNGAGGVAVNTGATGQILHNAFVGNGFAGTTDYLTGAISSGDATDFEIHNNVVTGNYYGVNCISCISNASYNNVWGNTTNYVNDASADAADLSADPLYVDATNGDYRLTDASPNIDAGTETWTLATDAYLTARPQGDGVDIGYHEFASSSYRLVITEVMANAASEGTGEFIEIYNAGRRTVDLAGFMVTDGDDDDILQAYGSSSTQLAAGAYALVLDSDYADDYSTIPDGTVLLTTGDTRLGNGMTTSDEVTLYEADGSTIASSYTHASDPGDGVSMELVDLDTGDASGNWRASVCDTSSSPGEAHCFPDSGDPAGLVITEIMANAVDEASGEYIELYNPTDLEIDGAGLIVIDGGGYSDTLVAFQGGTTLIGPGEHALILDAQYAYNYFIPGDITLLSAGTTIGNGLGNATDTAGLYLADGTTLVDSFSWPMATEDGISLEKIDYTAGDDETNWQAYDSACAGASSSSGRLNASAGGICGALVITEVMANPLTESSGEYVEIWNPSAIDIDLDGLIITDGDADDILSSRSGADTVVPAGGYALIVEDGYADDYTLDSSLVIVTTGDNHIGNGVSISDQVQLLEPDGSVITNAIFPFDPGNGFSAEKIDAYDVYALDSADNWTTSTCASGGSPGLENCSSSTGTSSATSDLELIISEVMSNPITESTGEYVEVYNAGTDAVDMLYMALYDGDAIDTIMGFSDIYDTVLEPGAYAVILDSGYAGEYTIPADALLLTTDDATVASGLSTNDPVYLYESGATALIDSYTFPFDAGNGTSVEKVDLSAGDLEDNWTASSCDATPGDTNCG